MSIEYSEKREYIRMATDSPMTFKEVGSSDVQQGHCINLSAAGILFVTDNKFEPGTKLEINITPKLSVVKPFDASVEVIRCAINKNGKYAIAGRIKIIN